MDNQKVPANVLDVLTLATELVEEQKKVLLMGRRVESDQYCCDHGKFFNEGM